MAPHMGRQQNLPTRLPGAPVNHPTRACGANQAAGIAPREAPRLASGAGGANLTAMHAGAGWLLKISSPFRHTLKRLPGTTAATLRRWRRLGPQHPAQVIVLGFFGAILAGTGILMLPIAKQG